ncbi:MAG: hypothetical protein KDK07_16780 [Bauldia sp.]|nr:hypothetical protein [Bauldia sp.]
MKIILLVRYSYVFPEAEAGVFVASQASRADYIAGILDPSRLKLRDFLFRNVLLESLRAQTVDLDPSWFRLAIATSHHLPQAARNDLEEAVRPYPWAKIEVDRSFADITTGFLKETAASGPVCFGSMRIDDDDALGRPYLESVIPYCSDPYVDHILSFPAGYVARFKTKQLRLKRFGYRYHPLNSAGMTYVGRFDPATGSMTSRKSDIFAAGSHARIDRDFPVISSARQPMFLRCIHGSQDTAADSREELRQSHPVAVEQVLKHVALSPILLG